MSELPLEELPDVVPAAYEAASGRVTWFTMHGERIAAIVPAELAAELDRLSPQELTDLLEDFADAAIARTARDSIKDGEPLIPWEQVKAEAGL